MTAADVLKFRSTINAVIADPPGALAEVRIRALAIDPGVFDLLRDLDGAGGVAALETIATRMLALNSSSGLPAAAKALVRHHRFHDLRPTHYVTIGQATIAMLAARSGTTFTDRDRSLWAEVFVTFAEAVMAENHNTLDLVA